MAVAGLLSGCGGKSSEIEDKVREEFKDPASVQFRDTKVCAGDPSIYQGEVNAKNGFGAYTGFSAFYASDATGAVSVLGQLSLSDDFSEMQDRCYTDTYQTRLQSGWAAPNVETLEQYDLGSDELGDFARGYTASRASEAATNAYSGYHATLNITCKKNETSVTVIWRTILWRDAEARSKLGYGGNTQKLTATIDGGAPTTLQSNLSSMHDATTLTEPPVPLLQRMAKGHQVRFDLVNDLGSGNPENLSATFQLDGMADAVAKVAEKCGSSL